MCIMIKIHQRAFGSKNKNLHRQVFIGIKILLSSRGNPSKSTFSRFKRPRQFSATIGQLSDRKVVRIVERRTYLIKLDIIYFGISDVVRTTPIRCLHVFLVKKIFNTKRIKPFTIGIDSVPAFRRVPKIPRSNVPSTSLSRGLNSKYRNRPIR